MALLILALMQRICLMSSLMLRSVERRVGKECRSRCRSGWGTAPTSYKQVSESMRRILTHAEKCGKDLTNERLRGWAGRSSPHLAINPHRKWNERKMRGLGPGIGCERRLVWTQR